MKRRIEFIRLTSIFCIVQIKKCSGVAFEKVSLEDKILICVLDTFLL